MTDLYWVKCPECGECTDLKRIGQVGNLYVRDKKTLKMAVKQSDRVKCGYCGTTFFTDEPTMVEAMGRDTVNETSL